MWSCTSTDLRKTVLALAVQGDLFAGSSDPAEWSTTMKEVCDPIMTASMPLHSEFRQEFRWQQRRT